MASQNGLRADLQQYYSRSARDRRLIQRRRAFLRRLERTNLREPPQPQEEGFFGKLVPDIVEKAGSQIGDALIHSIPGLYEMGKAGVLDAGDFLTKGDVTPERLGGIGEAIVKGTYEDFRHPLRNPGYLLLDLISLGTGGASLAARAGRSYKVAQAARAGAARPRFERRPLPPDESIGQAIRRDPDPEPPGPAVTERAGPRFPNKKEIKFRPHPKFTLALQHAQARGERNVEAVRYKGAIADLDVDDGSVVEIHKSREGEYQVLINRQGNVEKIGDAQKYGHALDIARDNVNFLQIKHERNIGVRDPLPMREFDEVRGRDKSHDQIEIERKEAAGFAFDEKTQEWIDVKNKEWDAKKGEWVEARKVEVDPAEAHHIDEIDHDLVVQALLENGGKFGINFIQRRFKMNYKDALNLRKTLFQGGFINKKGEVVAKREKAGPTVAAVDDVDKAAHVEYVKGRQADLKDMEKEIESLAKVDPDRASDMYDDYLAAVDELDEIKKAGPQPRKQSEAAATPMAATAPDAGSPAPGPAAEGVPSETATPRSQGSRTLPRDAGTSQRAKKVNDRELGINPRALKDAGIPEHVQKPIRAELKAAMLAGATPQKLAAIFRKHLGNEAGKKAYATWRKREMGPLFVDDLNEVATMGDAVRELFRRPQGGSHLFTVASRKRSGQAQGRDLHTLIRGNQVMSVGDDGRLTAIKRNVGDDPLGDVERGARPITQAKTSEALPVEIALSNSPLVRAFQQGRYKLMHVNPKSFEYRPAQYAVTVLQKVTRTGDAQMVKMVQKQLREFDRVREAAEKAGMLARMSEEDLAQFVAAEEARQRKAVQGDALSYFDSANQLAVIGALYLKPAYVSANLMGQMLLLTADHMLNPVSAYKNWRMSRRVFQANPEARAMIKAAMHEGIIESFGLQQGRIAPIGRVHRKLSKGYAKVLDEPFRDAVFFNEARRRGWKEENITDLLRPENRGEFIQIAQRANENIVDYGRLGPNERQYVRRLVFFYPWVKGATRYSTRFLTEHPAQAYATVGAGKFAQEEIEKELGPVPSYVLGSFVGPDIDIPGFGNMSERTLPDGTKVPRIINPAAVTVLGTLGETVGSARALIAGNPRESEQLSEYLTPAVGIGISVATRTDPFTGRTFPSEMTPADIVWQEAKQTIAPFDAVSDLGRISEYESGERPTDDVLFPYSSSERIGRFLGPTPYSYNPKEGRSRAFAERRGLAPATQREQMKAADDRKKLLEAAQKVGLVGKGSKTLPKPLRDALLLKARRETNLVAVEKEIGRPLTQLDRLQADLGLAVRMGRIQEAVANRVLEQAKLAPDPTVEYLARKFREALFGTQVISRYRKAINDRLALAGEERI